LELAKSRKFKDFCAICIRQPMNCGWTCLRLRIGFLISTHAYLYLMVNSLRSILSWREESRRKRSEEWLIWNNWLCTDFTWPSANSFFFSSPFHLVRISGRILMAVITLKWPDIPLMSFIHDFCWVALGGSEPFL